MKNKNNNRQPIVPLLALGLAATASACGGGSSSSSQAGTTGGTTGGGGNGNGGDDPPPPLVLADDIPLAIYENHPTNKAVYDAPERAEVTLTEGVADNDLFQMTDDGRIWWRASPDFETKADDDGDGVYIIRLSHSHNDQGYTEIAVRVEDIERERHHEDYETNLSDSVSYSFNPAEKDPDGLPTGIAKHLLGTSAFRLPAEGPLILTWSLELPQHSTTQPSGLDTQHDIDRARALFERVFDHFSQHVNIKFIEVIDLSSVDSHARDVGELRGDIIIHVQDPDSPSSGGGATRITIGVANLRYETAVHEVGHSLGLEHPFTAEGMSHGYGVTDDRYQRSFKTVMSYANWPEDTGLQPADIAALQWLYGAPGTDFDGVENRYGEDPPIL